MHPWVSGVSVGRPTFLFFGQYLRRGSFKTSSSVRPEDRRGKEFPVREEGTPLVQLNA